MATRRAKPFKHARALDSRTVAKLEHLERFIATRFNDWLVDRTDNVVAAYAARKRVKGRELFRYSIVFHVLKKGSYKKKQEIPPYYDVRFPGERKPRRIPTDVIESGPIKEYAAAGDRIRSTRTLEQGTVGFYCERLDPWPPHMNYIRYACTNAHVAATRQQLQQGHLFLSPDQQGATLHIDTPHGTYNGALEQMIYGGIDAALIRVGPDLPIVPDFDGNGAFRQPIGPPTEQWRNATVKLFGCKTGLHRATIAVPCVPSYAGSIPGKYMHNMIALNLDPQMLHGESGAPVVDLNNHLIGILWGGDKVYDYAIPIHAIIGAFGVRPFIQ